MTRRWLRYTAALTLLLGLPACGRSLSSATSTQGGISPTAGLVATTPPGTKQVSSVTWAVYRDVNSLDPAFAFDYPENTAISLMCESLLRQQPDGSVAPGLATVAYPSPTTAPAPTLPTPDPMARYAYTHLPRAFMPSPALHHHLPHSKLPLTPCL